MHTFIDTANLTKLLHNFKLMIRLHGPVMRYIFINSSASLILCFLMGDVLHQMLFPVRKAMDKLFTQLNVMFLQLCQVDTKCCIIMIILNHLSLYCYKAFMHHSPIQASKL